MLQKEMPWDCFSASSRLCPGHISHYFSLERKMIWNSTASPSSQFVFLRCGWSVCAHLTVLLSKEQGLFAGVSNGIQAGGAGSLGC